MARSPGDREGITRARGQRLGDGFVRVEALALLIKRRHHEIGAQPNRPGVRTGRASEHVEQRRLAAAIRADDPDTVAAPDADRKVGDDRTLTVRLADTAGLDHLGPGFVALRPCEHRLARNPTIFPSRLA